MNPDSLGPMVTFAIYLGLMVVMALYFYRRTNSQSDFVLGDRRLGSFVTALSANASDFSGWLLLGLPGAVYASGLGEAWIDRKSTRLNSSHVAISYAVFCLKKTKRH